MRGSPDGNGAAASEEDLQSAVASAVEDVCTRAHAELGPLAALAVDVAHRQFAGRRRPYLAVPSAVVSVLADPESPGESLRLAICTATALLYLGADVLDNVLDNELPEEWRGCDSRAVALAGAAMVALAPTPVLALTDQPAERVIAAASRLPAAAAVMAAGEVHDLRSDVTTPAQAAAIADAKAGEEFAAFAGVAARLTCGACVEAAEEFGRALGIAGQISSDCHDIWHRRPSHDLLSGSVTVPIAYALSTAPGPIAGLLRRARSEPEMHPLVATALAECGALTYSALRVQALVHRAAGWLPTFERHGHDATPLRQILDEFSITPRGPGRGSAASSRATAPDGSG